MHKNGKVNFYWGNNFVVNKLFVNTLFCGLFVFASRVVFKNVKIFES